EYVDFCQSEIAVDDVHRCEGGELAELPAEPGSFYLFHLNAADENRAPYDFIKGHNAEAGRRMRLREHRQSQAQRGQEQGELSHELTATPKQVGNATTRGTRAKSSFSCAVS